MHSLEGNLEASAAAQAAMREDYDGLLDKSAEEQKQYLVVMLERHAETMGAITRQQNISNEKIAQLKLSLDRAQAEADSMKDKYESSLAQTNWMVTKVTELEGLVSQLRERDLTIRRELGMGGEGVGFRKLDGSGHVPPEPHAPSGPSYFALTPEIPAADGNAGDDYVDNWWGDGLDWPQQDQNLGEPPGLDFGPTAPPPTLPADMRRTSEGAKKQGVKIPETAYKLLKDAPKLDLSAGGEPWEIGMMVHQWRVETRTVMTAIHLQFAAYFDRTYDQGRERYERKRLSGCEEPLPSLEAADSEMETRLSLTLLKCLPQAVRQPVVESSTSNSVRCVLMFESLHERYAPGGREELESIQRYLRQLPSASDFKGAMTTIRRWKLARSRAQSLGLPEQAPNESIAALDSLMRVLEKKNPQLAMKSNLLRMLPDIISPTTAGLDRYLGMLEVECRRLASDQEVRDARAAQSSEVVVAAEVAEKGKGRACFFHLKPGGCWRGASCPFEHKDAPKGGKGKDKRKGKGQG